MNRPDSRFRNDTKRFNKMYGMAVNEVPTIPFVSGVGNMSQRHQLLQRLAEFKKIMTDEINEVDLIYAKVAAGDPPSEVLTDLADWLGDMQVFCASEMMKFGLNNDVVLEIIMASNMSKLQADGTALFVEGKLQKGPGYWKPEPQIKRFIEAEWKDAVRTGATGSHSPAGDPPMAGQIEPLGELE